MKKKIMLFLLMGMCLMNSVTSYASSSVTIVREGSQENEYTSLPNAETLKKDAGFNPKAPAVLEGDYQFNSGNITETFDLDSTGAKINQKKGISFKYEKKTGGTDKSVTLFAEPASGQAFSENADVIEYGEYKMYYTTAQANSISWLDGDVYYNLMDINKKVTRDELTKMAKGMIDLKNSGSNVSSQ